MKKRARTQRLVSEINITPFTDVILVLLIVFMATTPLLMESGFKVNLPQSSTFQEPPKTVYVVINANGEILLENDKYSLRSDTGILKFKLASLIKNSSDASLIIKGDKEVKYDFVMKVVDLASQVGIKKIILATEFRGSGKS